GAHRRPVLHKALKMPRAPGVADVEKGTPLDSAAQTVTGTNYLKLLPAGLPVPDPGGLLSGRALESAIRRVHWPEVIIVDTPAASFFADATAIAAQCAVTLVVVNAQVSRRRSVRRLVEQPRQGG